MDSILTHGQYTDKLSEGSIATNTVHRFYVTITNTTVYYSVLFWMSHRFILGVQIEGSSWGCLQWNKKTRGCKPRTPLWIQCWCTHWQSCMLRIDTNRFTILRKRYHAITIFTLSHFSWSIWSWAVIWKVSVSGKYLAEQHIHCLLLQTDD